MHHPKFLSLTFTLIPTFVLLTACGPTNSLTVKGVDLSTSQVSGETYVNMDAVVAMGNLKFPNVEVPMINPTNLKSIGQLTLQSLADGTNRVYVQLDFNEATSLNSSQGSTLPNGREIPSLVGATAGTLIGIPIMDQSRVYVGGSLNKDLFVGAAIAIPAFDSVLSSLPTALNVFFNFPFSASVNGVGGFFTSPESSKSGVAIFVHKTATSTTISTLVQAQLRTLTTLTSTASSSPTPAAVTPTANSQDNEIGKMDRLTLYRLNRLLQKKATLRVK